MEVKLDPSHTNKAHIPELNLTTIKKTHTNTSYQNIKISLQKPIYLKCIIKIHKNNN